MSNNKDISKEYFSEDYYYNTKNSNYADYNMWDNDKIWQSEIDTVKKYNIKGKVLDVGCAFGFLLKRYDKYFDNIYGIDISDFAIKNAKEKLPEGIFNVVNINNEELPYPDESFDLITALDVLEHTDSIKNSMEKLLPKLKNNGYMIISMPVKDTWAGRIFKYIDKDHSHISIPKRKDLFNIIQDLGFEVLEYFYFINAGKFKLRIFPTTIEVIIKKK